MTAVYKRELRSYFTTPTGYIFAAVFLCAAGFIFSITTLQMQTNDVSTYYQILMYAYIVIIPLLTMKSFAEERRAKTEQLLMSSPVSLTSIVLGKFFAAATMFVLTFSLTLFFSIPLAVYSDPNWARIIGCSAGIIFIGLTFIAIGLFMSSLTDSQFTAAVSTIAVLAGLVVVAVLNGLINSPALRSVLDWISVYSRFQNFTYGIFDIPGAIYYLTVYAVFLFLTVRVFDRRRTA